jgi:ribosomal protein S6--L-glutamate ligase
MSTGAALRFCFILEAAYRRSRLPMAVVDRLRQLGHECAVVQPAAAPAELDMLLARGYAAFVLRTISRGPGLSLLQAAAASGFTTINDATAVQRVRDKLVMASIARAHTIPVPPTYLASSAEQLETLPRGLFPVVIKPSSGGFGDDVRLVRTPAELVAVVSDGLADQQLVAQPWVSNRGHDIKLYNTGQRIHAVRRRSSLLGGGDGDREPVAVTPELRELAVRVGRAFGLDLYGVDVVESPDGLVVVDVNDFPSYGTIESAPDELASTIARIVRGEARPEPA